MNIEDAAHRIGHEYPGGAGILAQRMGMNPVVFNSKLNPNTKTHHLSMVEALRMQQLAGRADILHAMAEALGYVAVPLPQVHDDDVAHALAATCAEFGDYLRRVDESMRDGKVTPNEVKRLEKELTEMVAAATHLQSILAGLSARKGE